MDEIKPTIKIELERYDELVKKEAMFDKLMEGRELSVYPYTVIKEENKENA